MSQRLWIRGLTGGLLVSGLLLVQGCAMLSESEQTSRQKNASVFQAPDKSMEVKLDEALKSGKAVVITRLMLATNFWIRSGDSEVKFMLPQGDMAPAESLIGGYQVTLVEPGMYVYQMQMLPLKASATLPKARVGKPVDSVLGAVNFSSASDIISVEGIATDSQKKPSFASFNVQAGEVVLIDGLSFNTFDIDKTRCVWANGKESVNCPLKALTLWHVPYRGTLLSDLQAAAKSKGMSRSFVDKIVGRTIDLGSLVQAKPIEVKEDGGEIYEVRRSTEATIPVAQKKISPQPQSPEPRKTTKPARK